MTASTADTTPVKRVLVATDRSPTAERAVRWAAHLAASHNAELLLFQVQVPGVSPDAGSNGHEPDRERAARQLQQYAEEIAGSRGRALVVVGDDPAQEVVEAAEREAADVIVVGNVGMSGRKQFLLGNIPNRISHNAPCTVTIVNTAPLTERDLRLPRQAPQEDAAPRRRDLARRAWRIGRVLARAGVREMLAGKNVSDENAMRARAQRLRAALDQLGPTFAKLGQILSTRPDLLPPVLIDELATLQDRVTPLTEAEVVSVMERELGVPWEDVFASIDPEPMAAGTIAQVHRATLETGERVVVKVQRPTAQDDILQDLGLLEMLAARVANRPKFREALDVPAIIEHLSSSLRRELDFRGEARNIKRMAEVLEPFSRLGVPAVYEEYSTSRLLVMQEIEGVPVRAAPPGPARDEAARQLLEAYYHQVMIAGFFHADPHPGNMKWWNDTIYLLDLGMVGEIDPGARQLILLLMLAFAEKDAPFLTQCVLLLSGTDNAADIDVAAFQADLAQLIANFRDLSLRELQLGPLLQQVARIAVRHHVRIPASFTLTGKAFAQMQLVAAELDPTLDPFSVAESYVLRSTMRQLARNLDPQTLFYEGQKLRLRLIRFAEAFEAAVGARPGGNLQVDFRGTERLEGTIAQASRRLSLALGMSGTMVVAAMTANSERVPRWLPMVLGGMGSVLAAGLVLDRARKRT